MIALSQISILCIRWNSICDGFTQRNNRSIGGNLKEATVIQALEISEAKHNSSTIQIATRSQLAVCLVETEPRKNTDSLIIETN